MNRQDLNTVLAVVLPVLFSALVGFIVWKVQRRITDGAMARAAEALRIAAEAEEKRAAIAVGHKELKDRVLELERVGAADSQSLALLRQEMLPMAEAMKRKLVEILTHPSDEFKIPDELLKPLNEVGAELPAELLPILAERARSRSPHVSRQEKLAARALPIMVEMAVLEAQDAGEAEITQVQLVSSTMKSAATKKDEEKG